MEVTLVTPDLFNVTYKARSQSFLVSKICVTVLIDLRNFHFDPCELIIHKNYAIYAFHPIFFFRDIDKALKIQ